MLSKPRTEQSVSIIDISHVMTGNGLWLLSCRHSAVQLWVECTEACRALHQWAAMLVLQQVPLDMVVDHLGLFMVVDIDEASDSRLWNARQGSRQHREHTQECKYSVYVE